MRRGPKPAKSKEAKSPVARKSLKDDDAKIRDLVKRLAESQAQQTATSEILRVISSSPTDLQPVFEAILRSAQRLLGARTTSVFRRLGDAVHLAAFTSAGEAGDVAYKSLFPMSLDDYRKRFPFAMRDWVTGTVTHIPDVERDARSPDIARPLAHARGFRSVLQVPMRREGQVIGVLGITSREAGAFADDEIALAQTFADQAVIAIENVRLFTELQEKNRALTEALDQQTATGEILGVISSSPTEVQPVFDAIARNAMQLLGGAGASVFLVSGDQVDLGATVQATAEAVASEGPQPFPLPLSEFSRRRPMAAQVLQTGVPASAADFETDPRVPEEVRQLMRALGLRSNAIVPMLREGAVIGVIVVTRTAPRVTTDRKSTRLNS